MKRAVAKITLMLIFINFLKNFIKILAMITWQIKVKMNPGDQFHTIFFFIKNNNLIWFHSTDLDDSIVWPLNIWFMCTRYYINSCEKRKAQLNFVELQKDVKKLNRNNFVNFTVTKFGGVWCK